MTYARRGSSGSFGRASKTGLFVGLSALALFASGVAGCSDDDASIVAGVDASDGNLDAGNVANEDASVATDAHVDTDAGGDADTCGACQAPAHGSATCTDGGCGFTCESGYEIAGDECLTAIPDWTRQFGTDGFDNARSVAVDASGNVFVAGNPGGTLPGQLPGSSTGGYLAKFDEKGTLLWTRQFGPSGFTVTMAVAVDASGNAFVLGNTDGTFPDQSPAGSTDGFLIKFDGSGNVVWTRQFGTNANEDNRGIAVDASGSAFVVGYTSGAFSGQMNAGSSDVFVIGFDKDGFRLWTRQFGTTSSDSGLTIAADANGNLVVGGSTYGALQATAGNGDAFVAKLDGFGNILWTRQFGSGGIDVASSVAVSSKGEVFATGYVLGVLPGQTFVGKLDAYVVKFDGTGGLLWARQFGTDQDDYANAIAVDARGNAVVAGFTSGVFSGQTPLGGADAFVAKLDETGKLLETERFGTDKDDYALGLALASRGKFVVVGQTAGALPGQDNLGQGDAFVRRISP